MQLRLLAICIPALKGRESFDEPVRPVPFAEPKPTALWICFVPSGKKDRHENKPDSGRQVASCVEVSHRMSLLGHASSASGLYND
jgi:hypothetical protein